MENGRPRPFFLFAAVYFWFVIPSARSSALARW